MPIDTSFWKADLAYAIADLPARLLHDGKEMNCSTSDLGDSTAFEDVIASRISGLTVTCSLSDFAVPPVDEDEVKVKLVGEKTWGLFLIDSISKHADGNGVTLTLRANQNNQPA